MRCTSLVATSHNINRLLSLSMLWCLSVYVVVCYACAASKSALFLSLKCTSQLWLSFYFCVQQTAKVEHSKRTAEYRSKKICHSVIMLLIFSARTADAVHFWGIFLYYAHCISTSILWMFNVCQQWSGQFMMMIVKWPFMRSSSDRASVDWCEILCENWPIAWASLLTVRLLCTLVEKHGLFIHSTGSLVRVFSCAHNNR